jgi:hypothetical protein
MLSLMTYDLPTGWRSLVLVELPDAEHPFSVLDIPLEEPLDEESDVRVVAHEIDDYFEARRIGHDYWLRSTQLGRPAAAA